ncbi:MAG: glycosyltransferase [Acetobacteraceae bacterium]
MTERAEMFVRLLRAEARERRRRYRASRDRAKARLAAADAAAREAAANAANERAGLLDRLREAERLAGERQAALDAFEASSSWRLTRPLRAVITGLQRQRERLSALRPHPMPRNDPELAADEEGEGEYQRWIDRFDTLTKDDRRAIRRHIDSGELPLILVLVRIDAAGQDRTEAALDGLRAQLLQRFRAILCFGEGCDPALIRRIAQATAGDDRVVVLEAPLAGSVGPAQPDCIVMVSARAILRDIALYVLAVAAKTNPDARLIYADEDRLDVDRRRADPWFKPCFSPELLRHTPYLGRCVLLRDAELDPDAMITRLFAAPDLAGFLAGCARGLSRRDVVRVPRIICHAADGGRRPHDPKPIEDTSPLVSIIIPTKDHADLLAACLASIQGVTSYPRSRIEILIIDNASIDPAALCLLSAAATDGRIRVLRDLRVFNYARINNDAARVARGDVLVFLNNDTTINRPEWLHRLVGLAMRGDVGAVGAKLLYPNGTVQHGGMIVGVEGVAGHAHLGLDECDQGYWGMAGFTREVAAVTGACLAIRRGLFEELGGFDERLGIAFNDVQFCLDAIARGYRNIVIAEPLVVHHESATRGFDDTVEKVALFRQEALRVRSRHAAIFKDDPYYSPNLSLERPYELAWPPRTVKPWREFARKTGAPARVLLLGARHNAGEGLIVVLRQQAAFLARRGFEVFTTGPLVDGCRAVLADGPTEAGCVAFEHDIDCVIAHTAPFLETVLSLGAHPRIIMHDYGEPDQELIPDVALRRHMRAEAAFYFAMADRLCPVRAGNSHLPRWNEEARARRNTTRVSLHLEGKLLVLTASRSRASGIHTYATVFDEFVLARPDLREHVVFAVAGKAAQDDVCDLEELGLRVFANLSNADLVELYAAADAYVSCARWTAYDRGVAQALAFGLPVIGADVQAHRGLPIDRADAPEEIAALLAEIADGLLATDAAVARTPVVLDWDDALAPLATAISELCDGA